jgi:hypothetical protein
VATVADQRLRAVLVLAVRPMTIRDRVAALWPHCELHGNSTWPRPCSVCEAEKVRPDYELPPQAYFDEAGKWGDSEFVCVGGYLARDADWMALARRWVDACRHHGLPGVHTSTFRQDCRRAGKLDQADAIFDDFVDIVRDHVLIGFAVAINVPDLAKVPSHIRKEVGDPQLACVQRVLRLLRDRLVAENFPDKIAITFDDSDDYAEKMHGLFNRVRKRDPSLRQSIVAVCFADDKVTQPVQAADMLVSLSLRWLKARVTTPDAPLPPPLQKLVEHKTQKGFGADLHHELWDEESLRQGFNELARRQERK